MGLLTGRTMLRVLESVQSKLGTSLILVCHLCCCNKSMLPKHMDSSWRRRPRLEAADLSCSQVNWKHLTYFFRWYMSIALVYCIDIHTSITSATDSHLEDCVQFNWPWPGFLIPVGKKNRNPPIKPIYREYQDFLFLFLFFFIFLFIFLFTF